MLSRLRERWQQVVHAVFQSDHAERVELGKWPWIILFSCGAHNSIGIDLYFDLTLKLILE